MQGEKEQKISTPYKKPSKSFRFVFLFFLIAVLLLAVATTYILVSGNKQTDSISQTEENPFSELSTTAYQNPFTQTTQAQTADPFAESGNENFFAQFDTGTTVNTTDYQNPF